jgi:hypothetical protein
MKHQLGLSLVVLAVLAVPSAWSQTGSDQSQSGSTDQSQSGSSSQPQSGPTNQSQSGSPDQSQGGSTDQGQQSSTGPQVAYTHPEQLPPLTLLNEVTANTGLKLSLLTGLLLNHNAYGGTTSSYWETLGMLGGGIHITQIRPTLLWDLRYQGGVSLTALTVKNANYATNLNQNGGVKILWQFASRWQLAVDDRYIYTNDPFEPYLTNAGVPTFNNPNPVFYAPQAITESNVGSATLTYKLGEHDNLNFTGGESFQRYINTPLSANNSYSYSGGASYDHDLSARLSLGAAYNFTALDYGHGLSRSGITAITPFGSYRLTPSMYITGFFGPEYTANKDIVPTFCFPGFGCFGYHAAYEAKWNLAEGATFGWSQTRNAVRLGFRHQNSDGGGLLGTVRLYQITASYRRALTQNWDLTAGISYNNSLSVSQYHANQFLKALQGNVSLGRNITPAWNATMYYATIHQSQNYYSPQASTLGSNGLGLSLRYSWSHSLGR